MMRTRITTTTAAAASKTKTNRTKSSSFRSVLAVAATASALALCSFLSPAEARIGTNSTPERRRLVPADEEEDTRYDFRQEILVNTGFLENADGVLTRNEPVRMEITIGDIPGFVPDADSADVYADVHAEGSGSA